MKNILTIALFSLLLSGCNSNGDPEPILSFNEQSGYIKLIATNVIDTINVKIETDFIKGFPNLRNSRKYIQITNDTVFNIKFKMIVPDMVDFEINKETSFTTYLIPSDTLIINLRQETLNQKKSNTIYEIKNKIFDYCQTKYRDLGYYKILDGPARKKWFLKLCTSEEQYNSLSNEIDSVAEQNIIFLEQNKNGLPDWFVKVEKNNIKYSSQHIKLILFQSLTNNSKKEKFELNEPIDNPDAKLSADYYCYIKSYFVYGTHLDFKNLNKDFSKIYAQIDSILEAPIKNIFITSYLASLYVSCKSIENANEVDNFLASLNYDLSTKELTYIQNEKTFIINELSDLISLNKGDVAPEFELKGIDGNHYKLSQFKGKIIYVHFWATWCAPCIKEMPTLNNLINNSDKTKFIVLNICLDDEPVKWERLIHDQKLLGLNLICDDSLHEKLFSQYKISNIPHYTLIDEKGFIINNHCERPDKIHDLLTSLMTEK